MVAQKKKELDARYFRFKQKQPGIKHVHMLTQKQN